jgi:hypothetical protein
MEAIQALTRRLGSPTSRDAAAWRTEVMRFSGLDDLTESLSQLVVRGPTMLRLQRSQGALYDMVSRIDLAARGELRSLEQRMSSVREDLAAAGRRSANEAKELQRLDAAPAAVARMVETAAQDLRRVAALATRRLDAALRDIVRTYAVAARDMLLAEPFARHEHAWRYDTSLLRRELERQFQKIYREAAEQLREVERTANAGVLDQIRDLLPHDALVAKDVPLRLIDPAPSIRALGQTVALELDEQWRAWWRLWHRQRQRARKLEALLSAEFHPIADALADAAGAELDVHVAASVQRFLQLGRDLAAMLNRRKVDLEANRRDQPKRKRGAQIQEHQARQKHLEQRIQDCGRIAAALKDLVRRCAALGPADRLSPG